MRRLLVENARRKKLLKRGGERRRISLEAAESLVQAPSEDLLAVDEALTRLTAHDPLQGEVVKLRFFAGLTMPEVAGGRVRPTTPVCPNPGRSPGRRCSWPPNRRKAKRSTMWGRETSSRKPART
jgi:hypothetical protein